VIGNEVHDHPDAVLVRLPHERLRFLQRPEQRIDVAIVRHVIAGVDHRRRVPGIDPDRVDPELAQVRKPRAQPGDVADAVAVAVGEAADVDLVDHGLAPPGDGTRAHAGAGEDRVHIRHAVSPESSVLGVIGRFSL
jgi:hypothetical protein